jgi:hypothetical protein
MTLQVLQCQLNLPHSQLLTMTMMVCSLQRNLTRRLVVINVLDQNNTDNERRLIKLQAYVPSYVW